MHQTNPYKNLFNIKCNFCIYHNYYIDLMAHTNKRSRLGSGHSIESQSQEIILN